MLRLSDVSANAVVDAVGALLDGGIICLHEGIPLDDPSPPLAEVRFSDPAFPAPVDGVAEAFDLTPGEGLRRGTASWFRALSRSRVPVLDGTVGDELTLTTSAVEPGAEVRIDRFTLRVGD